MRTNFQKVNTKILIYNIIIPRLEKWKFMAKLCNKNGENLDRKSDIIEINKNRKII